MKRMMHVAMAAAVALNGVAALDAAAKEPKVPKILEFDTMVGVPADMTGAKAPIRGINGGGLPWTIEGASGELKVDGRLELAVTGLVFAAGPNAGRNTVAAFRAIVSCLDAAGTPVNVATDPFPADTAGNAEVEARLALPQPCIAPIVFVTSPGGAWFATTGH